MRDELLSEAYDAVMAECPRDIREPLTNGREVQFPQLSTMLSHDPRGQWRFRRSDIDAWISDQVEQAGAESKEDEA